MEVVRRERSRASAARAMYDIASSSKLMPWFLAALIRFESQSKGKVRDIYP